MEKPTFIQCGDEKINQSFIIRAKKSSEYGHQIILNLADGQTVNLQFENAEVRDAEFLKIGEDKINPVTEWAMNMFNELKPYLEKYAQQAQDRLDRELKAEEEYQQWLKDNPPGSPNNPHFNAQFNPEPPKQPKPKKEPVKKK